MKTYLLIFLIAPLAFSQWETGGSYKIKSDVPAFGFGFFISKKLPFQSPSIGIKVRAEVNLFRETITPAGKTSKFLSEDYNIHLIGEYYPRYLYPYFGLGFGYGELNAGSRNWRGFVLSLVIGSKFPVSDLINPYIEIQGYNYFADFDRRKWGRGISMYQLRGVAGITIPINTL